MKRLIPTATALGLALALTATGAAATPGHAAPAPPIVSPEPTTPAATTDIGVYDLSVAPDAGTTFTPGAPGTLRFGVKPQGEAKGIPVKRGQSLIWTMVLPAGLTPVLPSPSVGNEWDIRFTAVPTGSGTTVTRTSLRKGPDVPDAGARNGGVALRLTATDALVDGSVVRVVFASLPGWTPASPSAETTVARHTTKPVTAAVTIDDDVDREATIGGEGDPDGIVTVTREGTPVGEPVAVRDGRWSVTIPSSIGAGRHEFRVKQTVGGDAAGSAMVAADFGAAVDVDGPSGRPDPGPIRVTGTGTTGARVVVETGGRQVTTTVADGVWGVDGLGATGFEQRVTATQTAPGRITTTATITLNEGAHPRDFAIESPADGDLYDLGVATFTGSGLRGSRITAVNQWGTSMTPRDGVRVGNDGTWSFQRNLGPTTAGYDIAVTQTAPGGAVTTIDLHLDQRIEVRPVAITSISDGAVYRPGANVLAGTGTPNGTVRAVNATNGWNVPMGTARIDAEGNWVLPERNWGPSNDYLIEVTQTSPDGSTAVDRVSVLAPVWAPLTIDRVDLGESADPGVRATFAGRSTPFAQVTLRSARTPDVYLRVEADAAGRWEATRTWNPEHEYRLIIEQVARDAQRDEVAYGPWTPIDG